MVLTVTFQELNAHMKQSNALDKNLYQILTYHTHPNITTSLNVPRNYTNRNIKEKPIQVMKAYGEAET
jgi:hypothetical protein